MYLMYADESGNTGTDLDNKEQPVFVLGLFSVIDSNWHDINNYFNKRKVEIYKGFNNIEIHANEIFSPPHKSIFHVKNWEENLTILNNIVDLILELEIEFNFVAIDKKKFKVDLHQKVGSFIKVNPYIYAFSVLYNYISKELDFKNDKGIIFLDEIVNIPEALRIIYPELSANNNSIIEQAVFLKSKDTNFIQIADVFSYYICQYFNINNGYKKYSEFKQKHCLDNYNKLITKTNRKLLIHL